MAVTKIKPIKSTLSKALDYIQNPDKTDEKVLVSSFGCSYETADIEFGFTLSQALEKGNNLAHHLIQAFEPGEVDYEKAHEIGRQLADAVTKGQHEYVLTTHIDKGHIHNHIIFCAVNFVDHHISGASGGLTSSAFRSGSKARCFQIRGRYTALCPRHFPNGQSRTQCPCGISLRSCLSYTPQVL